ncbi:cell number regulator 2-like [Hibiscus syriacus]|uniref:cell number regulator 2-like n=1 Tax=Hibiscus syriacus TaxID=106335 RepID=UPI001920E4B8|nr:cell number regulator 2-like [Hibiscus syriacus]
MNIFARTQPPPQWSASLCGCGNDVGTCCIACCLPCITFGQIAEMVDEGKSSCAQQGCIYGMLMLCSCHCLLSCVYREKLRVKFGLPAEPCNDCCIHFCCEACALCQEHAELKNRGFDPSKGWNHGTHTAPPRMPPTMKR